MANIELTEQELVYTSLALSYEIWRNEQRGPSFENNVTVLNQARQKIVETLKRDYPKDYDND